MAPNYQKLLFETTDEEMYKNLAKFDLTRVQVEQIYIQIRQWYNAQCHLPKHALDDRILARYLQISKYSTERTKEKIDTYFSSRTLFPEYLNDRDPCDSDILNSINFCEYVIMPKMIEDSYRLIIFRYSDVDLSLYNPNMLFKLILMTFDLALMYDTCEGEKHIWDFTNLKLGHLLKINPTMMKKMSFLMQKCYGTRMKEIHILNCPSYAESTLKFFKSLFGKKVSDRIYLHNNIEKVYKYIDRSYFPLEYGGSTKSCRDVIDNYVECLQSDSMKTWFLKSGQEKSDESKRMNSNDRVGDLLGIAGSFRKLDID